MYDYVYLCNVFVCWGGWKGCRESEGKTESHQNLSISYLLLVFNFFVKRHVNNKINIYI